MSENGELQVPDGSSRTQHTGNKAAGYSGSTYFSTHRLKKQTFGQRYSVTIGNKENLELLAEVLKRNGLIPAKGYKNIFQLIEKVEQAMELDKEVWDRKRFFINGETYVMESYPLNIDNGEFNLFLEDYWNMKDKQLKEIVACALGHMCFKLGFPFMTDNLDRISDGIECNVPNKEEYEDEEQANEDIERWEQSKKELGMLEQIRDELFKASKEDLKATCAKYRHKDSYNDKYKRFNEWLRCILNCVEEKFSFTDLYPDNELMSDDWSTDSLSRSVTLNRYGPLEHELDRDCEEINNNYTIVEPSYIIMHYRNRVEQNMTLRRSFEISDDIKIIIGFDITLLDKPDKKEGT